MALGHVTQCKVELDWDVVFKKTLNKRKINYTNTLEIKQFNTTFL